ncbi:Metallo-dependent phosphatase-like protein [Melampsora americana]|nr:Metallo-dependent phosphatase-like protein [Melampsora americana]
MLRSSKLIIITITIIITYQYIWKPYINSKHSNPSKPKPSSDPIINKYKQRIIAIGDLHGDLPNTIRVLRLAEVIDMKNKWIGKKTILVQTGDIVDRGKDTIVLYQLMDRLRIEAKSAGGSVVSLLGNHEYMNALGDWRYVTEEDIQTFGGKQNRRKLISSQGWIGKTWLENYKTTARVSYLILTDSNLNTTPLNHSSYFETFEDTSNNQNPFMNSAIAFVHGGITPDYARLGITKMNEIGKSFLNRTLQNPKPNGGLPIDTPLEEKSFYSSHGPLWERSYALEENEELICDQIEETIRILKVKRLVMGHTPQFKGILGRCQGKILLIDTGISSAYGGALSALEIQYTLSLNPKSNLDQNPTNWQESELVYALQEGKLKRILSQQTRSIELTLMNESESRLV